MSSRAAQVANTSTLVYRLLDEVVEINTTIARYTTKATEKLCEDERWAAQNSLLLVRVLLVIK